MLLSKMLYQVLINVAKTKVNVPGIYRGNCTELCGERHAYMPIVVKAVTQEEYEEWLQTKRDLDGTNSLLN